MKLNSHLLDEIKEQVVYISSRENQRVNPYPHSSLLLLCIFMTATQASGTLTATPRHIIFEPDWESPLMEQGMLNYRIQMSIR